MRVAQCCGVFRWIDARNLLVFDTPSEEQAGAWVVDVTSSTRTFIAAGFGLPTGARLVAIPDPEARRTEIRRLDGSLVSTIENDGVRTWISPDGRRLAWFEEAGIESVSSLVGRAVRLWSAGIDGNDAKQLLAFDATSIHWLPDNQHVIALARAPDGSEPGIWMVDTMTGTNGVVIRGTFLQALRLSPDGSRMAFLRTFSGNSDLDGVWIARTDGSNQIHLRQAESFRWAGDSAHLWFLDVAPRDGGNDALIKIDLETDSEIERVDLGDRVLNDQWDVSPDGAVIAYWSEQDQSVMVKPLVP